MWYAFWSPWPFPRPPMIVQAQLATALGEQCVAGTAPTAQSSPRTLEGDGGQGGGHGSLGCHGGDGQASGGGGPGRRGPGARCGVPPPPSPIASSDNRYGLPRDIREVTAGPEGKKSCHFFILLFPRCNASVELRVLLWFPTNVWIPRPPLLSAFGKFIGAGKKQFM